MYYLNKMLEWNKQEDIKINKYIRQTIHKQIRIHNNPNYIYRFDRVTQAIDWIQKNFMLTTGDLKNIYLYPTQRWWYELMLGYDMIDEKGRQVMLTTEIFLNLGRGSGKSSLMATRVLEWMILGGQFGGESLVIAYDNKQARHVYEQVQNQTLASPVLETFNENNVFRSTKDGLKFEPFQTKFSKQTNDVLRSQGGNSSLNIFDEVHTYGADVTEAVNKGSRQKQPSWQSVYITSGGLKRGGLYDTMIDRFQSEDEHNNDRSFGLLYKLEDKEQVKNKHNWSMALPLIGHVPTWQSVIEEYNLAQGNPALQSKFLAYNMGLQMQETTYFFTADEVEVSNFDLSVFENNRTFVGIDLSLVGDLTSVAYICELNNITYIHNQSFAIQSQYDALDDEQKEVWDKKIDEGSIVLFDTKQVNVNDIIPYMRDFKKLTNAKFTKIGYDPARYEILRSLIETYFYDVDGDNQVPIRQGYALSEYIKLLKSQLGTGKAKHHQNLMQWSLENSAVKIGVSGDYMLAKKLDKDKIDPVMSTIIALKVMVDYEQE